MTNGDLAPDGLSQLSARVAIQDCLFRYCHAVDRRRWGLMESVFHDDGMAKLSNAPASPWRKSVEQWAAMLAPLGTTHHQIGNVDIAFHVGRADVESYVTSFHHIPANAPSGGPFGGNGDAHDIYIYGRFIDRFERRDGEWRIADHRWVPDIRQPRSLDANPQPVQQSAIADSNSIHVVERWMA